MKQTITIDGEPYEVDRTVAGHIDEMQTEIETWRSLAQGSLGQLANKAAAIIAEFDNKQNGSWYCTHEQKNIARIIRETFNLPERDTGDSVDTPIATS